MTPVGLGAGGVHRAVALALVLACAACSTGGDRSTEGVPPGPFTLDLPVGTCFDGPASPDAGEVAEVPCDSPHDFEVIARVDLDDGDYPGDEAVGDAGAARCNDRFADYVGQPQGRSGLVLVPVVPDQRGWEDGARTVVCTVGGPSGEQLEGSVEGSEG